MFLVAFFFFFQFKQLQGVVTMALNHLYLYSQTSFNGPSEKRTTTIQRTNTKLRMDFLYIRSLWDADLPSSGQRTEQNSHYCYTIQKVLHLMDIQWHILKFTTVQTILKNQQVLSRVHRGSRWSAFITRSLVTCSQTFTNQTTTNREGILSHTTISIWKRTKSLNISQGQKPKFTRIVCKLWTWSLQRVNKCSRFTSSLA